MRAIICDKCGATQADTYYSTTAELNRKHIGAPNEVHLCSKCTEKFIQWINKKEKKE